MFGIKKIFSAILTNYANSLQGNKKTGVLVWVNYEGLLRSPLNLNRIHRGKFPIMLMIHQTLPKGKYEYSFSFIAHCPVILVSTNS